MLLKTEGEFSEESGWSGVKLLYLAGIYNIHTDPNVNTLLMFITLSNLLRFVCFRIKANYIHLR